MKKSNYVFLEYAFHNIKRQVPSVSLVFSEKILCGRSHNSTLTPDNPIHSNPHTRVNKAQTMRWICTDMGVTQLHLTV